MCRSYQGPLTTTNWFSPDSFHSGCFLAAPGSGATVTIVQATLNSLWPAQHPFWFRRPARRVRWKSRRVHLFLQNLPTVAKALRFPGDTFTRDPDAVLLLKRGIVHIPRSCLPNALTAVTVANISNLQVPRLFRPFGRAGICHSSRQP